MTRGRVVAAATAALGVAGVSFGFGDKPYAANALHMKKRVAKQVTQVENAERRDDIEVLSSNRVHDVWLKENAQYVSKSGTNLDSFIENKQIQWSEYSGETDKEQYRPVDFTHDAVRKWQAVCGDVYWKSPEKWADPDVYEGDNGKLTGELFDLVANNKVMHSCSWEVNQTVPDVYTTEGNREAFFAFRKQPLTQYFHTDHLTYEGADVSKDTKAEDKTLRTLKKAGIEFDSDTNRPLNPYGRTGISGRGLLGKWGANHAADPIVTRWETSNGKRVLQMLAIQREDTKEWAIPGGMVDAGETVSETAKREFREEAGNIKNPDKMKIFNEIWDELFKSGEVVYKGYVDDPRNTDNAWMETVWMHFHMNDKDAERMPHEGGSDAETSSWLTVYPVEERSEKLYASHQDMVDKAVRGLLIGTSVKVQHDLNSTGQYNYLNEKICYRLGYWKQPNEDIWIVYCADAEGENKIVSLHEKNMKSVPTTTQEPFEAGQKVFVPRAWWWKGPEGSVRSTSQKICKLLYMKNDSTHEWMARCNGANPKLHRVRESEMFLLPSPSPNEIMTAATATNLTSDSPHSHTDQTLVVTGKDTKSTLDKWLAFYHDIPNVFTEVFDEIRSGTLIKVKDLQTKDFKMLNGKTCKVLTYGIALDDKNKNPKEYWNVHCPDVNVNKIFRIQSKNMEFMQEVDKSSKFVSGGLVFVKELNEICTLEKKYLSRSKRVIGHLSALFRWEEAEPIISSAVNDQDPNVHDWKVVCSNSQRGSNSQGGDNTRWLNENEMLPLWNQSYSVAVLSETSYLVAKMILSQELEPREGRPVRVPWN